MLKLTEAQWHLLRLIESEECHCVGIGNMTAEALSRHGLIDRMEGRSAGRGYWYACRITPSGLQALEDGKNV